MLKQPLLLLIAGLAHLTVAISTISVKGAKFFTGGQQFFLKGVAYQGTPSDPLVDTTQCTLDAESMGAIGTNSIRVYHVDPDADHDGCMAAFAAKGIYVWLDLDTFGTMILQTGPTWTEDQFRAFAKVMDVFQKYDNLAGFWIGNEVITSLDGSPSAPYVKAAVADMKSYLSAKGYRSIPIGYSAADIAELRPQLQNYLACSSIETSIDFFGLNSYEWCGDANYQTSGYSNLQAMAVGYPVPMFMSETGCNVVPGGRTFTDQAAIFGPDMSGTWSGSIIYEWVQETNDYGLVNYPNGQIYSGAPIPIQPDFDNLKSQWSKVNPGGVSQGAYSSTLSMPACPSASGGWKVNGDVPLPTLGAAIVAAVAGGQASSTVPSSSPTPTPTASTADDVTSPTSTTPVSDSSTKAPSLSSSSGIPSTTSSLKSSSSSTSMILSSTIKPSIPSSSSVSSSDATPTISSSSPSSLSSSIQGPSNTSLSMSTSSNFATESSSSHSTASIITSTSSTPAASQVATTSTSSHNAGATLGVNGILGGFVGVGVLMLA